MVVGELNEEKLKHFLSQNNHSIFHTPKYKKFIEEAFRCKYKILGCVDGTEVKTILPIVEVKSKGFGNKIISSAYLEYGSFSGDENYTNEIINFLDKEYQNNFDYLEIRGGSEKFDGVLSSRLTKKNLYKRFVLDFTKLCSPSRKFTSGRVPSVWEERIMSNIQKSKRKAIKKSWKYLEVKEIPLGEIDKFYKLYCKNMRSFGSPCYSKKYFESFYENIVNNNLGKIYGAYDKEKGKLAAALLGFCYGDRVHILISVSNPKYQRYRPNDTVHYHFIEFAHMNNYRYFDFGRVREESGQFEYKRKWGPELMDLPSYFLLWKAKEIPIVDPSSTKYKLVSNVWKKMPISLTKLIGPKLRKRLGI